MTEAEAQRRAEELSQAHPDRETHRFVPRGEDDGGWSVVKINLPPAADDPVTETRADEKPPQADDPRGNLGRNVSGYGAL
jgi:hypothetical protein